MPIVIQQDRNPANALIAYTNEVMSVTIAVFDDDLNPVNMTGEVLGITFERYDKSIVAFVPTEAITIGGDNGNELTFDLPSEVSLKASILNFAIRRYGDDYVFGNGVTVVSYAP